MFRNRKRKVSPDKKLDKSKKLKVSSKIFRSPSSTKTNSEAKSKLSKLLPEGYDSIILTANTKPVESFEENEAIFGCVRLPILTKEDAMVWVKKFERKTFTSYRTQKTWKKDVNTGLFKRKYICNVRNKDVAGQAAAATCKGSIIFTIKDQEEIQANPDYYLRDYPSQVIIHFCHSHKIDPDSYMKNLRPSAELRIIFGTYFAKGHSPFSALICHKSDLHSSYGAEFYNVVSNGAICPSYNWCFHEYEKFFMRKFIEPSEDKLNEKLKDTVSQYNAKWRSECALILYNPVFVLSICTPLMKSIFRSGFAEELITVRCFSTPKTVPKRQKLILFLCHTPIGSLPFGVVVTFSEDTESVCEGIRALIKMFGVTTYSPKTIIIDENALVSKALKRCFPTAQVLFNEFQMLQSIWRIIRVVCTDDDEEFQALYNLFLVTLNSSSEEEFKKNFDSLLIYAEKYPKLTNFLKYFKVRSNSYVLYARPKIEFNTDVLNYTDSGTIILQDVSIKYGNFFNILQLFDFLSKSYVDHYERKLNKIVEGDLKGFFKTNFYVPLSKIADFTCEKISDTEFLVSLNEMKFFVNAELDTCTCQVGVHGGSCVHQYIVEKNLGLVPECYTPLCEDMLGIFKNILREKSIKPPLPDSDRLSELGSALDSLKSELDTFTQDPDDFSDIVSSVCCSEISNFSGMPHDMDHLGPLDEIFLVPPDINDSFTDITDEMMSPLVLSEFDDTNEDNEDFFDDSQQYNRESGELEPIESSNDTQGTKHFQNNVLVEGFPASLEQSIPTTGLFLNQDNSENVIIYEYTEDDIKCNNEVEVVGHCDPVAGETLVHLPADSSIVLSTGVEGYNISENITTDIESSMVYAYSGGNQSKVTFYEDVMTENDRKTAEIAEFLTNLPDTNNSSHHITTTKQQSSHRLVDAINAGSQDINTTPYISDKRRTTEQDQTVSNGVVVVRNEEYFTDYRVLENNILSVVTKGNGAFINNVKQNISNPEHYDTISQHTTRNLITDSYEENSFIMMSPNDLFDDNQNIEPDMSSDKQDVKINVLSSVVIKPPTYTPNFPLNLNTIKHKTLRNVKEDSRIRMNEQRITQSGNTIFIHDPLKSEPRKIVLPIIIKNESNNSPNLLGIKNTGNRSIQTLEKDVIKLYCNQSGEKSVLEDNEGKETKVFQQQVLLSKTPLEGGPPEKNLVKEETLLLHTPVLAPSQGDSQELNQDLSDAEIGIQEYDKEVSGSEELEALVEYNSNDDSQELNQGVSDPDYDKSIFDSKDLMLADCDPEELAKHDYVEIVEMDSDGLEELASQKYDPILIFSETPSKPASSQSSLPQKSSFKVTPLKTLPSNMLHFKSFSVEDASLTSNYMPLRDFMSKIAPSQVQLQQKLSPVCNENKLLQEPITTRISQSQSVLNRNSVKKPKRDLFNIKENLTKSTRNLDQNTEKYCDNSENNSIANSSLEPIGEIINNNMNKLNSPQKRETKSMNTQQLKEQNKNGLLDPKYNEIKEKISSKNSKNPGSHIKQSETIKETVKENNVETTKNQKVLVTNMYESDSDETSLSDFENLSDLFESFSSGVDDLSEDELQYLWEDDSSNESVYDSHHSGTTYEERVRRKLSNKLGVKTLKERDVSVSQNPQSDDNSSDKIINPVGLSGATNKYKLQPNLPPGIRLALIKNKTNKLIESPSDHFDNNSSNKSIGLFNPSGSTNEKHVRNKLPKCQQNIRNAEAQKSEQLRENMLKKTNKSVIENLPSLVDGGDNSADVGVSSKKKHYHIKSNLHSNIPITEKLNIKSEQDQLQTKSANEKTTLDIKLMLKQLDKSILDKSDDTCTNLTPNKIKQRLNPKIFSNKNKKLSNTTLKLDSLPSILSQPYDRRIGRGHKTQGLKVNEPTNMKTTFKNNTPKIADKIANDNAKIIADKKDVEQSIQINSVLQERKDELMPSPSLTNAPLSISKSSQYKGNTSISGQAGKIINCSREDLLRIKGKFRTLQANVDIGKSTNKKDIKQSIPKNCAPQWAEGKSLSRPLLPNNSLLIKTIKSTPEFSSNSVPLIVALEKTPQYQKPISQAGKDIKNLEAILTSDNDIDRDLFSDVNAENNIHTPSILQNQDLSFIFDDPRFETVVEEESVPAGSFTGITPVQTKNTNIVSGSAPSFVNKVISDVHKENLLNFGEKETSGKSKRKYGDVFNVSVDNTPGVSINKESYSNQKMVKCTENNSFTKPGVRSQKAEPNKQVTKYSNTNTNTNTCQTTGQDHVITLLVYANVLKSNTPNITKELNLIHEKSPIKLKVDTGNQNVKKGNVFLDPTQKNDQKESSNISDSLESESHIREATIERSYQSPLRRKASTSESKANKLELPRKEIIMQADEKNKNTYRRRRSKSNNITTKGTLTTGMENTWDIKTKPENIIDIKTSKKKVEKALKTFDPKTITLDLVQPRQRARGEITLNKEMKQSQMQEVNLSKKEIFNKSVKSRRQNRESDNLKKDNDSLTPKNKKQVSPNKKVQKNSFGSVRTRSKTIHKELSPEKEKNSGITNLVQKETTCAIRAVEDKKRNQHKGDLTLFNDSKTYTSLSSHTRKTVIDCHEDLLSKKRKPYTIETNNNRKSKKSTNQSLRKSIVPSEEKTLSSTFAANDSASTSKLVGDSTRESFSKRSTASLSLNYDESDDFENSITASFLAKNQTPRKNLKPIETKEGLLASSTPKISIGYEDAFKMFLETSNQRQLNTQYVQSVSDFEKDIDDSDWESNGESRRRTRSVSSAKEKRLDNKKLVSGKMKKSVSWAEGLNVIEYIRESDSDSNNSEIIVLSRKKRRNQKRSSSPKKLDKLTVQKEQTIIGNHTKDVSRSRSQNSYARRGTNVTNEKQLNSPILSTPIFQGRSLVRTEDSIKLGNRLRRSRSSTPKREKVKTIDKKRSQSHSRVNNGELKLVILLERNKEIDRMCLALGNLTPVNLRSRRGGRVGYKELLHRARLSKMF